MLSVLSRTAIRYLINVDSVAVAETVSMMNLLSYFTPILLATFARAVVGPGVVTGDTAVHDPTMCKDNSGTYFVFCELFPFL